MLSRLFPLRHCTDSDPIAMLRTTIKVLYNLLFHITKSLYTVCSSVYAYEARSVLVLLATAPKGSNKIAFTPPASCPFVLITSPGYGPCCCSLNHSMILYWDRMVWTIESRGFSEHLTEANITQTYINALNA